MSELFTMRRLAMGLVRAYQLLFSSWRAPSCRFVPSCSEYAMQAIAVHGAWRGGWLAVRRLARCHPFGGSGLDEVPGAPGCNHGGTHGHRAKHGSSNLTSD